MSFPGPTAIAVTPTGGRRTKDDHPAIPLTPAEHAYTVASCVEAGACMVHLHVRRADGRHLLDAEAYADATNAIRAATGDRAVVQITSEALGLYQPAEQRAVVRAVRPEAVSLALRELAPDAASEKPFGAFMGWLRREGIVPQVILYAADEGVRLAALQSLEWCRSKPCRSSMSSGGTPQARPRPRLTCCRSWRRTSPGRGIG